MTLLKRLMLAFQIAGKWSTIESMMATIELLSQNLFESNQENRRLESVLENIAALHPVGGQRRLLAKAALPKELRPVV